MALVQSADQRDLFQTHLPILKAKVNKSDKGTFAKTKGSYSNLIAINVLVVVK